jgi:Berberine and berberine like
MRPAWWRDQPGIGEGDCLSRDIGFVLNIHTRWREPADDAECIAWARSLFESCKPYATGGVYVNFMPEEEKDRVVSAYLGNSERLAAIKAKYDPHDLSG